MIKIRRSAMVAAMAMTIGLLTSAAPALADRAPTALDELIASADRIVIGSVVNVRETSRPGEHLASIVVNDELLGSGRRTIRLLGSTTDPGRPRFFPGSRMLAFLSHDGSVGSPPVKNSSQRRRGSQGGGVDLEQVDPSPSRGGPRFVPVGGDQGIMLLAAGSIGSTRALMTRAISTGSALALADVRQQLAAGEFLPPPLLGALFEQLSRGAKVADAPDILPMVCQPDGYGAHAAIWAVSQVGKLGLRNGRACLENIVSDGSDRGLSILAVDALGDLGEPESAPLLASLLTPFPIPPTLVLVDDEPDDIVGSHDDPEDDSNPVSDPGEDDAQFVPPPVPLEVPLNAGDEPFDDSADDDGQDSSGPPTSGAAEDRAAEAVNEPPRRGVDGGLAQAAILALGKIGVPATIAPVANIAREGDDLALHSTVVRALGMFGPAAMPQLNGIRQQHPNPHVRQLADQTIRRLQG